jgi:hypothetical protein
MTEEQLWTKVFAHIPRPFKDHIGLCKNAVLLRRGRVVTLLAEVERKRGGILLSRSPFRPIRLGEGTTERTAHLITDAAFEVVRDSLALPAVPPLVLDLGREYIEWEPTGEKMAFLEGFADVDDLKRYLYQIIGFRYRVSLADALREALKIQGSVTVVWGAEEILVKRRDRTVAICDGEPAAVIILRGGRYGAGRTVISADYGVLPDRDVITPAVSFLRFAD